MNSKKIIIFSLLPVILFISILSCLASEQDQQGVYVTAKLEEGGVGNAGELYVMHTVYLKNYNHNQFEGDIITTITVTLENGKVFTKTITTTNSEYKEWKKSQDMNPFPNGNPPPKQKEEFDRVNMISEHQIESELGIYQVSSSKKNPVIIDPSVKGKAKLLITYKAGDKSGTVLEQEIIIGDRWFRGVTVRGGADAEITNLTISKITILGNMSLSDAVDIEVLGYSNLPPEAVAQLKTQLKNSDMYTKSSIEVLASIKNNGDKPLHNLEYDVEIPEIGYKYSFRVPSFWKKTWLSILRLTAPKSDLEYAISTGILWNINEGESVKVDIVPTLKNGKPDTLAKLTSGEPFVNGLFKTTGVYTIKVTLDPENKIVEANEQNNVYTTQFQVGDVKDLLSELNNRAVKQN